MINQMRPAAKKSKKTPKNPLNQILVNIHAIAQDKKKSLVVFDLDSTLFDVSPRLEKIIHNFCEVAENKKYFPEEVQALKKIKMQRSDWGIANAMSRVGIELQSENFHLCIKKFWLESFFSGPYLHFDRPFEGAVQFTQAVIDAGAEIVYLTGRDRPRMFDGTKEVLKKWDFPLNDINARLELKPTQTMDDGDFKKNWFLQIPQGKYQKIWFFENEPMNINLIQKVIPHVEVIFFDSTHCGKEQPPADIQKIFHFLIDDDN